MLSTSTNRLENSKKTKLGKGRLDKYYYLAKEKGYRSRAAFKLLQINKKYEFLQNAKVVLDICAAPGGWAQVARKIVPMGSEVFGVDLAPIKHIEGFQSIEGDICLPKTMNRLKQLMRNQKCDVVLHDGAPNVGANWNRDSYAQCELVLHSLRMACQCLRKDGIFVTKVFRSTDYTTLIWALKQLFDKVEATKPKASRNTSAEIYVVCLGYKDPKRIDHKMFNPNFLFSEKMEPANLKYELAWRKGKRKRNREGYEDGDYVLFKTNSVKEFIETDRPVAFLVRYTVLEFDKESEIYLNHELTTEEIKILCSDTKVLSKYDFRLLLKWRNKMIQFRNTLNLEGDKMEGVENLSDDDDEYDDDVQQNKAAEEMDDVDMVQNELQKLKKKAERRKKNLEKKEKLKQAKRPLQAQDLTERRQDIMDNMEDDQLFQLSSIHDEKMLEQTIDVTKASSFLDQDIRMEEQLRREAGEDDIDDDESDVDDDEKRDQLIEKNLDGWYDKYKSKLSKTKLQQLKNMKDLDTEKRNELYKEIKADFSDYIGSDNPLLVGIEAEQKGNRQSKIWFGQNIFSTLAEEDEFDELEASRKMKRRKITHEGHSSDESEQDEEEQLPEELDDPEVRATTLAIAKQMLDKKKRRDLIDNAYNRHTWNDVDDLPDWFQDDHHLAHKPILPITKEQVMKEKKRLAELDSRPIKAKLEAQFRRKRKMAKNRKVWLEKAKAVTENPEMTAKQKSAELRKIYKNASGKEKQEKIYVTPGSRPSRKQLQKKRTSGGAVKFKSVDRRMKADRPRKR